MGSPCRPECLDGEDLTLLHFSLIRVFDKWDGFSAVDAVTLNIVRREAPHWLDWKGPAVDLDLVALHRFLNSGAHITHTYVDPSSLSWY